MAARSRAGWVYSPRFLEHNSQLPHPECPVRLTSILEGLSRDGLIERLLPLTFSEATDNELATAHTRRYIATLDKSEGQQLDPDTYCGEGTPAIARLAAGAVLAAGRAVMRGEVKNVFCAVRPPGHHAPADRAMGFCYFNNAAVAAANIIASDPGRRVLILDWDVHHGNGTQAIFYDSSDVLYASSHQYPLYPGTGAANEIGRGEGRGFTINKPLQAGSGDDEFLGAIEAILAEVTAKLKPDLVILSAGFDAHRDDPLANLNVSEEGFAQATRMVCDFAKRTCDGRLVSVLEGGYNLTALAKSVSAHVRVLLEDANET